MFETIEDLKARIDDPDLDIDENCIMVLKGCGPKGYPGMAEVGNMPLPPKILRKGITDMVRISDARMSGTAYGTVVLHVAPEAAAGGPLALVQTGDVIELDVPARKLHLDVSDAELAKRREAVGGARAAEARLLQAVCRARAAGRQGRGPRLPGRRQRHHRHPRLSLGASATSENAVEATASVKFSDISRDLARVSVGQGPYPGPRPPAATKMTGVSSPRRPSGCRTFRPFVRADSERQHGEAAGGRISVPNYTAVSCRLSRCGGYCRLAEALPDST